MTNTNLTDITMVMDRSGSMVDCREDTQGGFDTYIEEQRKVSGECRVSLFQFDDQFDTVYSGLPISEVPKCKLQPRGYTALLDAIGKAITIKGEEFSKLPEKDRPGTVIMVILTDGGENASREYNQAKIKNMIDTQTSKFSWMFVFLGANQDAIANAGKIGIHYNNSLTYDTHNTKQTFASLSNSTSLYRGAVAAGASYAVASAAAAFDEDDREKAVTSK